MYKNNIEAMNELKEILKGSFENKFTGEISVESVDWDNKNMYNVELKSWKPTKCVYHHNYGAISIERELSWYELNKIINYNRK